LGHASNHEFQVGVLPPLLTSFHCGKNYNCKFKTGVLPSSLTALIVDFITIVSLKQVYCLHHSQFFIVDFITIVSFDEMYCLRS